MTYGKLVRDKIPQIIEANGEHPITRELSDEECRTELEKKLQEECQEVLTASGSDRLEELADVFEVMKSLAKIENATIEDVIAIADAKNQKRGGFDAKIFLEDVK